ITRKFAGLPPNLACVAARAAPPVRTTSTVLQSIARTWPSSCAGQRAAMRSAAKPHASPRMPAIAICAVGSVDQSVEIVTGAAGAGCREPRSALGARQGQLDQRRVGDPGRAAGGERRDLAEVAGTGDVEVDPRLRHELADEQGALHEAALV